MDETSSLFHIESRFAGHIDNACAQQPEGSFQNSGESFLSGRCLQRHSGKSSFDAVHLRLKLFRVGLFTFPCAGYVNCMRIEFFEIHKLRVGAHLAFAW